MLIWWENLPGRERTAIAVGGLLLLLLLGYLLIQPLLGKRTRLRDEVSSRKAELAWMRDAAKEIAQSDGGSSSGSPATPVLQLIDQAARDNHLTNQLKRLEPGTGTDIKVWLNNAAYVDLVRWLRQPASLIRTMQFWD